MSTLDPPAPIPGGRLLFSLDPAIAHLNHGSFGAVPIAVQRTQQRLRDEMEANPMRFFGVGLEDRIAHTRRHIADFLGADPDGSALVPNTTTGVAIVLHSLGLRPGDEIVTTNHGYGAVAIAVADACRHTGAVHRVAELPTVPENAAVVDGVRGACSSRTRLVIIDWITSATARLFPVNEVVEALRGSGAEVLVDAAHAPGLRAEPVSASGATFWIGNLHKWGYAPRGTALFSVSAAWRDRIRPLVASWQLPSGFPANVEWQGTQDYTPWLAAPVGLYSLRTLGIETVRAHNAALAAYGQQVIGDALGLKPADLPAGPLPMRVIPLPAGTATDHTEAYALRRRISEELSTEVAVNAWPGGGLLRVSAQIYNRPAEYDRLAAGLPELLRDA